MQRQGTARIPPQARQLHQIACPASHPVGLDYATLGSNPRKPKAQVDVPLLALCLIGW